MNIEYKILWVEDNKEWYNKSKKVLTKKIKKYGFMMSCTHKENLTQLLEMINEDKTRLKTFDMLLVDFKLEESKHNSKNGDKVIKEIRNQNIYTDVIFYSSQIDEIHEILKNNELDGIYISHRDKLRDKFPKIFSKTINKIQDINAMRGLVMAETSKLDVLMLEIIESKLKQEKKSNIKTLEKYILTNVIKKSVNSNLKDANSKTKTIFEKINKPSLFTSDHKARTINKIEKGFHKKYKKEILELRNNLAHVKEEDGQLINTNTEKKETFDDAQCIQIRKDLIKYRKQLEALKQSLSTE